MVTRFVEQSQMVRGFRILREGNDFFLFCLLAHIILRAFARLTLLNVINYGCFGNFICVSHCLFIIQPTYMFYRTLHFICKSLSDVICEKDDIFDVIRNTR